MCVNPCSDTIGKDLGQPPGRPPGPPCNHNDDVSENDYCEDKNKNKNDDCLMMLVKMIIMRK